MKNRLHALIVFVFTVSILTGCYSTVDGGRKTGLPWMKDTIEGRYERPSDQIYDAAVEVLRFNGSLVGENRVNDSLVGKIDTKTVWIRVEAIGPKLTRVLVQARRSGGLPDIDLASEIEKQIALRLK